MGSCSRFLWSRRSASGCSRGDAGRRTFSGPERWVRRFTAQWGVAKLVRHQTLTLACVGSSPAAPEAIFKGTPPRGANARCEGQSLHIDDLNIHLRSSDDETQI